MSWFKRSEKGIQTKTEEKKDIPKGLWYKTPTGKIVETQELASNAYVSPEDDYHVHIGSKEYFEILFDDNHFKELDENLKSKDFLNFRDSKKYVDRLKDAQKKSGLIDAIRTAVGKSKARMMESANSLMQMAKTSAKLAELAESKLPFISLCTDPTTGGTTASFAMLGDINIGEPGALIAFAGPRVVKDTTGRELPEGFQKSEFLLEKGFLDFICHRKQLKNKINLYLDLILNQPLRD
jgi:acetyl-CoA carboxylase carboxyl transferase subunit beta